MLETQLLLRPTKVPCRGEIDYFEPQSTIRRATHYLWRKSNCVSNEYSVPEIWTIIFEEKLKSERTKTFSIWLVGLKYGQVLLFPR